MEWDLKSYNNRTVTKENSSALSMDSGFPTWEDYKNSVDDIQYFLIGVYTLISLAGFMGNLLILVALIKLATNDFPSLNDYLEDMMEFPNCKDGNTSMQETE